MGGSQSSPSMTKTDFEKLLQDSSFAAVKAQATQAQQASQANKDSIASLDVTPAGIATLVNSAIQSGSVKETITRTAQGAISNNYVTDAKLNALIQNVNIMAHNVWAGGKVDSRNGNFTNVTYYSKAGLVCTGAGVC